jgi:putative membrane protein
MKLNISKETGIIAAKGFCMGSADVVPGVSGGTMAFILGIYPRLLAAINSFDLIWLRMVMRFDVKGALTHPHFDFLLPLVVGIFAALLFFTRIVPLPSYLETDPELVYGLFFGLIVGSIVVLLRHIPQWSAMRWAQLIVGTILGWLVVNLVPTTTPDDAWFIFLSGALAITAMILPGISGSFILLILGKYAYIFDALGHFRFTVIIPFALGAATGLALFSRFLEWLLRVYRQGTIMVITGILVGSLWLIWPFQNRVYVEVRGKQRLLGSTPELPDRLDSIILLSVLLMVAGFITVLVIDRLSMMKEDAPSPPLPQASEGE